MDPDSHESNNNAETPQQAVGLKMKPLEDKFRTGEKELPPLPNMTVQGKPIEAHPKGFFAPNPGSQETPDEMVMRTKGNATRYFNAEEKAESQVSFSPITAQQEWQRERDSYVASESAPHREVAANAKAALVGFSWENYEKSMEIDNQLRAEIAKIEAKADQLFANFTPKPDASLHQTRLVEVKPKASQAPRQPAEVDADGKYKPADYSEEPIAPPAPTLIAKDVPLDTGAKGNIFVMDENAEVYASPADQQVVTDSGIKVDNHHSSFLAGGDVAGAGALHVNSTGRLKEVTDGSGHYQPGSDQVKQTLQQLEKKGVNLDNVKFSVDRTLPDQSGTKLTGMAGELLQRTAFPESSEPWKQRDPVPDLKESNDYNFGTDDNGIKPSTLEPEAQQPDHNDNIIVRTDEEMQADQIRQQQTKSLKERKTNRDLVADFSNRHNTINELKKHVTPEERAADQVSPSSIRAKAGLKPPPDGSNQNAPTRGIR